MSPPAPAPGPVRVIIKLPYNRPSEGISNPPKVEWNGEKEAVLWEVIAKSRSSEIIGTDWQGLATHLDVPLPYLLFRAQTRYEEDLKGLQGLRGNIATSPTQRQVNGAHPEENSPQAELQRRLSNRASGSGRLHNSTRLSNPVAIRARLNSLGHDSASRSKAASSSTVTLQGHRNMHTARNGPSPPPSDSDSESDDEANRVEAEERKLEEQDALEKKLKHLQTVMTSEAVGLVRDPRSTKGKGKEPVRGRELRSPTSPLRHQTFQREDLSSSERNSLTSNTSSPQGSIPDIPSPPPEASVSPSSRHLQHGAKSSSPPAVSSHFARGHPHMQYRPMAVNHAYISDRSSTQGSTQGSSASSFSDISEPMNVSTSALESALMSNIRGTGAKLTNFARFTRRTS